MEKFENPDHNLLEMLLEAAAIRKRADSKFRSSFYKLFQGICWLSFCIVIVNCATYLAVEDGDKMMTVAIISMTIQSFSYNVLLARKSNEITSMINTSDRILKNLKLDTWTNQELELADHRSKRFIKFFVPLLASNIVLAVVQAGAKMMMTGQPTYPFEQSCLGLPLTPCWLLQVITIGHVAYFIALYFCVIKIILYRLSAYYVILSRKFEEKSAEDDEKADRQLFVLFSDISSLAVYFSKIFGVTAFVEVALVAVRNSFQSYHVLMNSILKKGIRNSKWFESSPAARKRLLPVLMFAKEPIRFHYRRFIVFNMDRFTQVMRTTYSLITAIANFL